MNPDTGARLYDYLCRKPEGVHDCPLGAVKPPAVERYGLLIPVSNSAVGAVEVNNGRSVVNAINGHVGLFGQAECGGRGLNGAGRAALALTIAPIIIVLADVAHLHLEG